jgi:Zn-finger nucleic acid-binding protein
VEIDELDIVFLELKYCERCGGLWLRPRGCDGVLCASCCAQMAELTGAWRKRNARALKAAIRVDGDPAEVVVCGEGGNA